MANRQSKVMEERARRQKEAAEKAREFVKSWRPDVCGCTHHSKYRCIRTQLTKIAREWDDRFVTEAMLWVAYRDEMRRRGTW